MPAIAAVGLVGLALVPLISAQVNPTHIGWIEESLLSTRFFQTGVSFLVGETGHVIAEPPRERYALLPAILFAVALLLVAVRGSRRERRGALIGLVVGLGRRRLALIAALTGKDYVVERNLLPALVPLAIAAALGFAVDRARRLGLLLAVALCAYWIAFGVHVTQTPNLQRPDFRGITEELGPPRGPRAIVTWKLAADPVRFYLHDTRAAHLQWRMAAAHDRRDQQVARRPRRNRRAREIPPSRAGKVRAPHPDPLHGQPPPRHPLLRAEATIHTGFGFNAVVVDGEQRRLP